MLMSLFILKSDVMKNTPFEDIKSLEEKEVFKRLKSAVEHREYRKIKFIGREKA